MVIKMSLVLQLTLINDWYTKIIQIISHNGVESLCTISSAWFVMKAYLMGLNDRLNMINYKLNLILYVSCSYAHAWCWR